MKIINRVFGPAESYKEIVKGFEKIDTVLSLLVVLAYFVAMTLMGILNSYMSKLEMTIVGAIINLLFVGLILLILKFRHQGLNSVGLKGGNLVLSLRMGGFLAIMLFFCNCLLNILFENQSLISIPKIMLYAVYFLTVGLAEELLFRGFLQTRLYAVTKHIWIDVLITGVLFVLMHFPFRMVGYNMTFWELISNVNYMSDLFVTHLIFSYIRIKSDNLYGAILPHWMSDLAYGIVTHI